MRAEEVAAVVQTLDSDEIADRVNSLPDEQRQAVLDQVDRADQAEVHAVLSFPEDSVGAMMDLDFVAVREDATLEAVHRLLRRKNPLPAPPCSTAPPIAYWPSLSWRPRRPSSAQSGGMILRVGIGKRGGVGKGG